MSVEKVCVIIFSHLLTLAITDIGCSIYGKRRISNNLINFGIYLVASALNAVLFIFISIQWVFVILSFLLIFVYSFTYEIPILKHIISVSVIWIVGV